MRLYSSKHHCTVPVWGVPDQDDLGLEVFAFVASSL